jgi:Do/DeqQ family serine protease
MVRRVLFFALLLSVGFIGGLVLTGRMPSAGETAALQPESAGEQAGRAAQTGRGLPDLTAVAERAIASVPNISSLQVLRQPTSPLANDPFFRYFFGEQDPWRERRQQSLGSGVVVSPDGYVLTNNHVVGDIRAQVTVVMPDKREIRAKIVGVDEGTDLAVLKIDARNLPAVTWGDSSKLRVAEWVLAIGNPFGVLNQTVTFGIVSATSRNISGLSLYEDFIQTDAAINRGNSGGALINARGELVGINSAIFSETGGYQGVGFAVPANTARRVMNELIEHGEVRRGTIAGIVLTPMTTYFAEQLGLKDARGLLVREMYDDSDAYEAGLRPGDVILSFNGTPIEDGSHFFRMLADTPIDSTATLGIVRDGRQLTLRVPVTQATSGRDPRRRR